MQQNLLSGFSHQTFLRFAIETKTKLSHKGATLQTPDFKVAKKSRRKIMLPFDLPTRPAEYHVADESLFIFQWQDGSSANEYGEIDAVATRNVQDMREKS